MLCASHDIQGDLVLDLSELVIEFVLKLAVNAEKLNEVEIDPSNTSVHIIVLPPIFPYILYMHYDVEA